jgi:hypothetical protein
VAVIVHWGVPVSSGLKPVPDIVTEVPGSAPRGGEPEGGEPEGEVIVTAAFTVKVGLGPDVSPPLPVTATVYTPPGAVVETTNVPSKMVPA